jgi:uncharacterized membrane protein YebE (DUF533 family)
MPKFNAQRPSARLPAPLAVQVYAAAHLLAATAPEKAFIENLAKALALDPGLVAHIDATAAASAQPAH